MHKQLAWLVFLKLNAVSFRKAKSSKENENVGRCLFHGTSLPMSSNSPHILDTEHTKQASFFVTKQASTSLIFIAHCCTNARRPNAFPL